MDTPAVVVSPARVRSLVQEFAFLVGARDASPIAVAFVIETVSHNVTAAIRAGF